MPKRKPAARLTVPKELQPVKMPDVSPTRTLTPAQKRRAKVPTSMTQTIARGGKNKRGQDCRWGTTSEGWCKQAPIRPDTVIHIHRDERGRPSGLAGQPHSNVSGTGASPRAIPNGTSMGSKALGLAKTWGPAVVALTPWGRVAGRIGSIAAGAFKARKAIVATPRITAAARLLPRITKP